MLPLVESLNHYPFKHSTLNTSKHYQDNCFSRTIYALRTFDRCLFHLQVAVVVCMDEGYYSFEARKLKYPEVNSWESSVPLKTLMWVCDWDFVPWQKYDSSFFIWVLYWWLLVDLWYKPFNEDDLSEEKQCGGIMGNYFFFYNFPNNIKWTF